MISAKIDQCFIEKALLNLVSKKRVAFVQLDFLSNASFPDIVLVGTLDVCNSFIEPLV
jgi:hypothetical protein